jgi:cytochrome P450
LPAVGIQDTVAIQMMRTSDLNIRILEVVLSVVDRDVPEIELADPAVLLDPAAAYGDARERSPLARLTAPGFGPMWAVTRHAQARAMLADGRFELTAQSYLRMDVPEDCRPFLRTMQEMEGPEHLRLRRLAAPAFTARRAAEFRPRIERIVHRLLDDLAAPAGPTASGAPAASAAATVRAATGTGAESSEPESVDLVTRFARPVPIDTICELVGIPEADRPRWREYGAAVAGGDGPGLVAAVPEIIASARAAVAARRAEPADDLLSELVRTRTEDGDRLDDTELVTLVWNLVLAGQTPANLIANGLAALLTRADQRAAVTARPELMPGAVDELMRWCGPQLLTVPRYPREDVELGGVSIRAGEPVTAVILAANRDPRVFADPERLDVTRRDAAAHLGFAHGAHFCLGAALARVQTDVALTELLRRFPDLAPAATNLRHLPDPATWRLAALPVTLAAPGSVTGS